MKKPRTRKDLENDPRLISVERTFAPECPWIATTAYPYMFDGSNSRTEQGTIKQICDAMESIEKCPEAWYK
jgi:hypothetical protein